MLNSLAHILISWRTVEVLAILFASVGLISALRQSRNAINEQFLIHIEGGISILRSGILSTLNQKKSVVDEYEKIGALTTSDAKAARIWILDVSSAVHNPNKPELLLKKVQALPAKQTSVLHGVLSGMEGEVKHYNNRRAEAEKYKNKLVPGTTEEILIVLSPYLLGIGILLALTKAIFQP